MSSTAVKADPALVQMDATSVTTSKDAGVIEIDRKRASQNLTDLAKGALARGALPLQDHVDYVLRHLTQEEYEDALRRTLGDFILAVNRSANGAVRTTARAVTNTGTQHASKRVAAIADAWSKMLGRQIRIGENEYRVLGDATSAEVRLFAASLEEHARKTATNAAAYHELAAAMERRECPRVRDLPGDVGSRFVTSLAA